MDPVRFPGVVRMYRRILLILWLGLPSFVGAVEPPLRFAPLPMESRELMAREYLGPMHYLEEQLARPVEMVYTADYQALIEGFRRNEIDLAYIGPLPYVLLSQGFEAAVPLVRFLEADGRDHYTCALTVFGKEPLAVGDVRGRRLALPDRLSTCAEVGMLPILEKAGVTLDEVSRSHLGRRDAVALAVIVDQADAGGLKTTIARKYASLGLRIIAESPPMPGFVLVGNRNTLPAPVLEQLRAAFLSLRPREDAVAAQRMHGWGGTMRFGAVPAEDADFTELRRQWARLEQGH